MSDLQRRILTLRTELWQLADAGALTAEPGLDLGALVRSVDEHLHSAEGLLRGVHLHRAPSAGAPQVRVHVHPAPGAPSLGALQSAHAPGKVHTQTVSPVQNVHSGAQGAHGVREQSLRVDPELWALAAEVHAEGKQSRKFRVEDVARVLNAHRHKGLSPDQLYRAKIGPHRDVCKKWIDRATEIERNRSMK